MTFDELFSRSILHAERSEQMLLPDDAAGRGPSLEQAAIEATLAEAYARLASAAVVNRTSLHTLVEAEQARGGRPS